MARKETHTASGIERVPDAAPSLPSVEPARQASPPLCDYCDASPGRYTCTGCKKKRYCSKACQERSWETHIFSCRAKKKSIKSYHHLARAVAQDLLPTDQQTLVDWGLERACYSEDGDKGPFMLFGLYVGLINYLDLPAKTLDQWRRNGTLLQEIKKAYEAIPVASRGGYYPWLLRNEFTLDTSLSLPNTPEDLAGRQLRDAWIFAGRDPSCIPSIQQAPHSMPPRQFECMGLCGMILNHCHPPPTLSMWLNFGFCVGSQYSEMCVGRLYQQLVRSASYQEILTAYETCGMVALFQRKGLTSGFEYSSLSEQFADVMSGSGRGLFKSSWNLKQFVQVKTDDPTEEFHMIPSIRVDYGFVNCKSDAEFKLLLKVYQEYFQSDMNNCVHLHAACIKGELFEYLGKFTKVPLTQQHRRLMKNPYPLLDL